MKKLIALILALAMVFSLAACAAKPVVEEPIEPEEPIETEEEPSNVNAGVFWYDYSDAFLSTIREALDAELDTLGITYTDYDAKNTQATQNYQVDAAIAHGANLLIVNIVDTAAMDAAQSIADKAKDAGIPVIFFNREVSDDVINSYENACFVGIRAAEVGEAQGAMAGQYIAENYDAIDRNGDGSISYIMLKAEPGCPESEARTLFSVEFCNAALTAAGKSELVYYDPDNTDLYQPFGRQIEIDDLWSKATAFKQMTTALTANPIDCDYPIEVVFANNDDMALGCVEALNDVGFNTGDGNFIPVFGIDYTPEAEAAIEAGKMTGSILQSATGMSQTIAALVSNVEAEQHVFEGATDNFHVDEHAAKIRVPYEIKMKEN